MKLSRDQKHQVNRSVHALTETLRAVMTEEAQSACAQGEFDPQVWRPAWWPASADVSNDSAGVAE